uniref:Uncharacterized protein n=1 Tax=Anopheles coluzzii TaxID=1518534 RepID=A0A8W7PPK4_ANOCL
MDSVRRDTQSSLICTHDTADRRLVSPLAALSIVELSEHCCVSKCPSVHQRGYGECIKLLCCNSIPLTDAPSLIFSNIGKRIARSPISNAKSECWFSKEANRNLANVCIGTDSGCIISPNPLVGPPSSNCTLSFRSTPTRTESRSMLRRRCIN